jgi:predicted RNase H-like nuclease
MTVVGVDCATVNKKTGLAFAVIAGATLTIEECLVAKPKVRVSDQIYARLQGHSAALLALDAPLGWPSEMGTHLSEHSAGKALSIESDVLFRRRTDQIIRDRLHKAPLEVAANFIARTAVSALRLLTELSELDHRIIPLAWDPSQQKGIHAIEVYPAGTLRAYLKMGYLRSAGTTVQQKRALLRKLERDGRLRLETDVVRSMENPHVLDSAMCCVAALDFFQGKSISPRFEDKEKATKEGWIWVRDPDA